MFVQGSGCHMIQENFIVLAVIKMLECIPNVVVNSYSIW